MSPNQLSKAELYALAYQLELRAHDRLNAIANKFTPDSERDAYRESVRAALAMLDRAYELCPTGLAS